MEEKKGLDKQNLLKPRYKVIALWPFENEREIGTIYTEPTVNRGGQWTNVWSWWDELAKHPHLFKKLEWYEEREGKDMPEYLKKRDDFIGKQVSPGIWLVPVEPEPDVFKVISYDETNPYLFSFKTNYEPSPNFSIYYFLPATKEEYEAQNKN